MFKILLKSLEMDLSYTTNSILYTLKRLPVLRDILPDHIYSNRFLKVVIYIISIIFFIGRALLLKFFYFFLILYFSYRFFPNHIVRAYFHIYFILTMIGLFINNKLLNTSTKNYFSLLLFKMDATSYFRTYLFWNQITNLLLNTICIFFYGFLIQSPPIYSIMLILLTFFVRLTGELLNIIFFRKYHYMWYSNSKLYFLILVSFTGFGLLPFLNVYISLNTIYYFTLFFIVIGSISLYYLLQIKDYKLLYKKLSQMTNAMNSKNDKDYLKQAMVELKKKDIEINSKKIEGKKGFDYFNTIFFERHREIMIRSIKKYSFLLIGLYLILGIGMKINTFYESKILFFLENHLSWFIIIMLVLNRGAIITQAMFFNCDHTMLQYNFYREKENILDLFIIRLKTMIKLNMIPALIVGIGNSILLLLGNNTSIKILISSFLFVISLSIFFSVHYLSIYYLLQPFNKDLEVKKASYSFVMMITYMLCYIFLDISKNTIYLSLTGIIIMGFYTTIMILLVRKFSSKTFKLN